MPVSHFLLSDECTILYTMNEYGCDKKENWRQGTEGHSNMFFFLPKKGGGRRRMLSRGLEGEGGGWGDTGSMFR